MLFSLFAVFICFLCLAFQHPIHAVAPTVTSFNVTASSVGTTTGTGLTQFRPTDTITIVGTNFGSTQSTSTISIAGVPVTTIGVWGASSITGVVVPYTEGTTQCDNAGASVSVNVPGSGTGTKGGTIMPTITSISPSSIAVGGTMTINGYCFGHPGAGSQNVAGNNVKFNGTAAPDVSFATWVNYKIVVPVPSGATSGKVIVTELTFASNTASYATAAYTIVSSYSAPTSLGQKTLAATLPNATTYYYQVTAGTDYGETTANTATSVTTTNSSSKNTVTWNAVQGAKYYNVYRGIGSSTMTQVIQTVNTTLIDDGNLTWISYNTSGDISNWSLGSTFPVQLNRNVVLTWNGYIYSMGGWNGSVKLSTVYFAPLATNGVIGSWKATTSLPDITEEQRGVVYNGYAYLVGGINSVGTIATSYYGKFNADGTISSWSTDSNALSQAESEASVTAYNGFLYVAGGCGTTCPTSAVQYARLDPTTGSPSPWVTNTNSLSTGVYESGLVQNNGYIYSVAGFTGGGAISTVQYASFNKDGSISSFLTTTSALAIISDPLISIYNNYLYIIGGYNGTTDVSTVSYAKFNTNGTLGSFSNSGNNLPTQVSTAGAGGGMYNGYFYIVQGCNFTTCPATVGQTPDVWMSHINAPTNVTGLNATFSASGTSLANATNNAGMAEFNGYMYYIGGCATTCPTTASYNAKINADGTLGAWTAITSLPIATDQMCAVAYNGFLYTLGGNQASVVSTVYYASINSDGTIGSWITSAKSLGVALDFNACFANDGYLYSLGGANATPAVITTVYYSVLNLSTGAPGTFNTTTVLPQALESTNVIMAYGNIYVVGGFNTSAQTTVYHSVIGSNGTLGAWTTDSTTNPLPAVRYEGGLAYMNGYLYYIGGFDGSTGDTTVYYAQVSTSGTVGAWSTSSKPLSSALYGQNTAEFNGYIFSVGGTTGGVKQTATLVTQENDPLVVPSSNTAHTDLNANTISWNAVTSATAYRVYKSTTTGSETNYYPLTTSTSTTFVDTNATLPSTTATIGSGSTAPTVSGTSTAAVGGSIFYNKIYFYKVTAIVGGVESNPSTEQTITANGTIAVPGGVSVGTTPSVAATTISGGAWLNGPNVQFAGTVASTLGSDTLTLLVEIEPYTTSFTSAGNTIVTQGWGVYKSASVAYSGSGVAVTLAISNLPQGVPYHWQVATGGTLGYGTFTANGGSPDFGIDTTLPNVSYTDVSVPGVNTLAWSAAPTQLFSTGFETGGITKAASGDWDSDTNAGAGSSLPTIVSDTTGPIFKGTAMGYCVSGNGATNTSYMTNSSLNTSAAQMTAYINITSQTFAATGDTITVLRLSAGGTAIASLKLTLTSAQAVEVILKNEVGGGSATGTINIVPNQWYALTLNANVNSSTATLTSYVNGVQDAQLTSQNTGSSNITNADLGIIASSSTDGLVMNVDNVHIENTASVTLLQSDSPTPYTNSNPYFEILGENDTTSGINTFTVSVNATVTTIPATSNASDSYTSSALSTSGFYYYSFTITDYASNVSLPAIGYVFNFYEPPPSTPTSLLQYSNSGCTTSMSNGGWANGVSGTICFTMSMASPLGSDTLTPNIEIEPTASSFTGTPNYSGSSVGYSGTPVTGTVTVTGLTNCSGYKWQAIVSNVGGNSTAAVYNVTTPNFSVSNSTPTATTIYDGSTSGVENGTTISITSLAANWSNFTFGCAGAAATPYTTYIGTTSGGSDILTETSTGISTGTPNSYAGGSSLALRTGKTYYVTVKGYDAAGNTITATSSGQFIAPAISFSLSSSNVSIPALTNGNSYTGTATTTLNALTNTYNGYSIYMAESGSFLSQTDNTTTIGDFSGGTYASPAVWNLGAYGLGYTSSCTSIGGSNKFSSGTLYAPFNHTAPGDIVAQNAATVTGSTYTGTNDTYTITYKAATTASQNAGTYKTNIYSTIVAAF